MTPQQLLVARETQTQEHGLHEIFEAQAEKRPDSIAVIFDQEEVSYGELDQRTNRLARHLQKRGVGRGSVVAMLLPRSVDAYVTLLAILKAGAAYVPIDPMYPADRVAYILEDSGADVLVTRSSLADRHQTFDGTVVCVDADAGSIAAEGPTPLPRDENRVEPEDLCYIIYTSGSTGRPKGVMVEHRNACHLVRAEGRIFAVRPDDRVYQGASLAFDLAVEEVWLAFHAGAALIAATAEMAHGGADLSRQLAQRGVTVLSCAPTLLSMMEEDVPGLRLLILGGETCSNQLVERWAKAGRRIVNTYGPTETTVIATYTDVSPDQPVTIGRPVRGYQIHILDDELRPVRPGQTGEICIGGAGVARGYVGLPAETQARFVADPFAAPGSTGGRIYRTGDLGRLDHQGNVHFLGRADGQVKLRGLRVELSEIESVLLEGPGVLAAGCAVRINGAGIPHLVGYVVPREGCAVDEDDLGSRLRSQLPAWMVPAVIESVSDLPRLPNGKLDRASLPEPRPRSEAQPGQPEHPATATERRLLEVWRDLFQPLRVTTHDDFFLDLGGHSLFAARMVSELRKAPKFASVTVADVYKHPTISRLAAAIDSAAPARGETPTAAAASPGDAQERVRHFLAGVAQSASLYFVFGFRGISSVAPYLVYFLLAAHHSTWQSAAWAAASGMGALPLLLLLAIGAKWMLLGRIRAGRHPLWGAYYLRWWFVQTLVESLPLTRLGGTPWLPVVFRLLGARIGKNVHLATDRLGAFDLISIGHGASVDEGASLLGYTVERGELVIGPVTVGRGCFIGARTVLCGHSAMEDGARLDDLSLLAGGARIPAGETWAGSPPRRVECIKPDAPPPACGRGHRTAVAALYGAVLLAFPLLELAAFVPGIAILTYFHGWRVWFAAPLAGASFILCLTLQVVALKWLLIGRARAGKYPVHGWFYVRNWVVEQLLALGVNVAGPLHATLYLKPFYWALGAKLGRLVEFSTASTTTPDLLEIADGATIADEASLGAARVESGWLTLAPTKLGRRAFVGNSAVIPAGTTLGDCSLVGVLTVAPSGEGQAAQSGACWLGSPPIVLPHRQSSVFSEKTTFRPGRKLLWSRAFCEIARVTLPDAGFILVAVAVIQVALRLWAQWGTALTLVCLPAILAACALTAVLLVAVIKWVVIGRYRPFERPLWSTFLWRLEFVNALFEFLATPLALDALQGTPLLPWYLRLLGARIGRRVYVGSTGFLEWDLVEIGDRAVLNHECILQTHLFEDRVLKGANLRVGADCEIGEQSIVLYDTEIGDGARVGPLSLVMKGETLPAGTAWVGSPLSAA
ncbi:MAG TPA: Pls/PosA family non-ribosomal peptide synthetase [Bryobacteraceae bacterium]|jgi:non-ribosomal peptide synthetase-like protein|nr:Pls/PosA family non-ribosomal peptide synthetase [Bryobacteraceae bacterium]